jgi:hypothetical protein
MRDIYACSVNLMILILTSSGLEVLVELLLRQLDALCV